MNQQNVSGVIYYPYVTLSVIIVGSDACIRIWTLHSGELMRYIEPSEYGAAGSHDLPTICYSETLGGKQFNPSLLVGINNRIVQFTIP